MNKFKSAKDDINSSLVIGLFLYVITYLMNIGKVATARLGIYYGLIGVLCFIFVVLTILLVSNEKVSGGIMCFVLGFIQLLTSSNFFSSLVGVLLMIMAIRYIICYYKDRNQSND